MKTLNVGDSLLVRLDKDSKWLDEWIQVKVKGITICHNPRKDPNELDPFVCVGVEHPKLTAFNYTTYCQQKAVKFYE